jgi:hypothetical protein
MAKVALFITHRTLPGKHDEVFRVWQQHLPPRIEANPAHEAYFYCFDDDDPDLIRVFRQYSDAAASQVIGIAVGADLRFPAGWMGPRFEAGRASAMRIGRPWEIGALADAEAIVAGST